jgi:5'-nucleotidase
VAAVREAILHGWPGIAFSHYRKGADFDWPRATRWITPLLRELLDRPIEPGSFTPSPPAGRRARPRGHLVPARSETAPFNYRHEEETGLYYAGDYNLRGRTRKADVDVCFNGNTAVSHVKLLWEAESWNPSASSGGESPRCGVNGSRDSILRAGAVCTTGENL